MSKDGKETCLYFVVIPFLNVQSLLNQYLNSEYLGLSVKLSQHNSIHAPSTEDSKGQLNSEWIYEGIDFPK